ncbi:hypothetical protein FNV43_RR06403 [Rhamnella rubrinervis]|uniref:Uncharacterized protein n=1 Tax=Rhamnella rubrinervis TaxID=2594499 RepID=A0A8K0MLR5_9ROSA|nr:hypothetical protein FNV43_RR06403 [Rhamnella rubrinervis]
MDRTAPCQCLALLSRHRWPLADAFCFLAGWRAPGARSPCWLGRVPAGLGARARSAGWGRCPRWPRGPARCALAARLLRPRWGQVPSAALGCRRAAGLVPACAPCWLPALARRAAGGAPACLALDALPRGPARGCGAASLPPCWSLLCGWAGGSACWLWGATLARWGIARAGPGRPLARGQPSALGLGCRAAGARPPLGHEYGGRVFDNTGDGEPSRGSNSEDGSAQNIREDTQGIEGFAITDIRSSIKTTDRLRRLLLPFGMTLTAEEFMYMYHLKKDPKRGRFRSSGWKLNSAHHDYGRDEEEIERDEEEWGREKGNDGSKFVLFLPPTFCLPDPRGFFFLYLVFSEVILFRQVFHKDTSPAINEMETISSDVQASLLATLGVKLEDKARRLDADCKLKEDTIQKLQDGLSKSETRIKELESDIIESEETNKKKIKDLEETMVQLEEKSAKPFVRIA